MEAGNFSETLVKIYQTTRHHVPKDSSVISAEAQGPLICRTYEVGCCTLPWPSMTGGGEEVTLPSSTDTTLEFGDVTLLQQLNTSEDY
jgi:hypothetical protein